MSSAQVLITIPLSYHSGTITGTCLGGSKRQFTSPKRKASEPLQPTSIYYRLQIKRDKLGHTLTECAWRKDWSIRENKRGRWREGHQYETRDCKVATAVLSWGVIVNRLELSNAATRASSRNSCSSQPTNQPPVTVACPATTAEPPPANDPPRLTPPSLFLRALSWSYSSRSLHSVHILFLLLLLLLVHWNCWPCVVPLLRPHVRHRRLFHPQPPTSLLTSPGTKCLTVPLPLLLTGVRTRNYRRSPLHPHPSAPHRPVFSDRVYDNRSAPEQHRSPTFARLQFTSLPHWDLLQFFHCFPALNFYI